MIPQKRRRDSASETLRHLHWLDVDARVIFKVLLLVYKVLKGMCCQNFGLQYKGFNGRPSEFLLLQTPNFKTVYGKRVFAYHGSRLWNALPVKVREQEDVEKFKTMIKTILYKGSQDMRRKAFKYRQ